MNLRFTISLVVMLMLNAGINAQSRGSVNYYQEIFNFSENQTENAINQQIPLGLPSWLVNLLVGVDNGIKGYKINYNTIDFDNNMTTATGLIIVPDVSCDVDMLTYCHGTVFDPSDVPSNMSGAGDGMEIIIGYYYAANGYLTVMPDYLGLGDETTDTHLYVNEKTEASATRDLMVAAKNLQNTLNYDLTGDVMITGYSQGGHAAMSTFKNLNSSSIGGLSIEAVGLGSGPYNLSGSQYDMIVNDPYYPNPEFLLYVMASCEEAYGNIYNTPSDILRQPYADLYVTNILGQTGEVDWVPSYYPSMFQAGVYNDLIYNNNNPTKQCLQQNNVYDWYHTKPLEMYYCTGDEIVTPQNSHDAEDAMEDYYSWWQFWLFNQVNAAYSGWFDHGTCVVPYAILNKLELDLYQSWCWWWLDEEIDNRSEDTEGLAHRTRMYYDLDIDVSRLPQGIATVELYNLDGETVLTVNQPVASDNFVNLNVSDLEAGLYGINITTKDGTLIETAALKMEAELIRHPEYDPISFNNFNNEIVLDLSLLLDEVIEFNIYDQSTRLEKVNGLQESESLKIDASELPAGKELALQVITEKQSYFLPFKVNLDANLENGLYLFPNPTMGDLTVQAEEAFNTLRLYNQEGKLVFEDIKDQSSKVQSYTLDLPVGIYQLVMETLDGKQFMERLIIK